MDLFLLGTEWPTRALLRAQLVDEGYGVFAADLWPIHEEAAKVLAEARVVIVDLQGIPDPQTVLEELRTLIDPHRVLVLTASGTLPKEEVCSLGFNAIARPVSIAEIVAAALALLGRRPRRFS